MQSPMGKRLCNHRWAPKRAYGPKVLKGPRPFPLLQSFQEPQGCSPIIEETHPIGVATWPPKVAAARLAYHRNASDWRGCAAAQGLGLAFAFLYLVSIGESEKSNAPVRRALVPGLRPQAFAPSRRPVASTHTAWQQPPSVHDGEVARRLTFPKCSSKNDTALNAWQHDRR